MKYTLRIVFNFIFLLVILGILFSYAMFQGGFVSWFLFYSFAPFCLYYIGLFFYPIGGWKVHSELSRYVLNAGQSVTVDVKIKRKVPFPIVYCICEQIVPESLHKKDTRYEKYDYFDDPSLIYHKRQAKRLIFPWFRRSIHLSFDFPHLPRGEHEFNEFRIRIGDLFGFINKERTFQLTDQFIVYPAKRTANVIRQAGDYEDGSVASYSLNLRHTNVAAGVREYVPGDKISWIDWKQTARHQEIMTKEFEEEKNVDMMVVFDGTDHVGINPIAFEGAVELTLALMDAFAQDHSQVGLLSLGENVSRFSVQDSTLNRGNIMHHLARVQPVSKQPLSLQAKQEMMKLDNNYIFLLVTTTLGDEIKRTIDELDIRARKIVILYVHGKKSVTAKEEVNLQYMIKQNIHVCLITEAQLKHDPIEVKF